MSIIISGVLYVCLAAAQQDPCEYHEPEHGFGHVAYSRSMPFFDLAREALAECEVVHGEDQCELSCWESREVNHVE
jgi:hypothetical protein